MNHALTTFVIIIAGLVAKPLKASENTVPLTLENALSQALGTNPDVAASRARADVEHSAIRSQYWIDNPKIGLMHEAHLTSEESQMGPMSLWSVSQEVKFPAKYFLRGAAQKSRAEAADEASDVKKLEIRRQVIAGYYNLFTVDRIIALLQAQKETLREVARAAELRHATGTVPQQDEMKAHVEQTKIENELILSQQEREAMEATLNAVLNREAHESIMLPAEEFLVPTLTVSLDEIPKLAQHRSHRIKQASFFADEASSKKSLATLSYAPDFNFSYRRAFLNAPANAYAAAIEISFPLWFFTKQSSEVAQASAMQVEAEKILEKTSRDLNADVRSFVVKVRSHEKILQIYRTALIPQVTTTLNSSRAAYQAGRINFIELLDSERSLYETRISYYRNLALYVESLAKLEEVAGASLSTLPFGEIQ